MDEELAPGPSPQTGGQCLNVWVEIIGVPPGVGARPVTLNIFISDTDSRIKCTLRKFLDDIKLCGVANTPEGQVAIQRDLDKLSNRPR